MQTRGLLLGSVALLLLAGGVWRSEHTRQKEEAEKPDVGKLVSLKEEEVESLSIQRREGEAVSLRKDKSGWQFVHPSGLRVDTSEVSAVLSTFTGLTQDRVVEEKASDLGTFGLATPTLKVTASAGGKGSKTVLIGDETPTGNAFYARMDGDPRVFTIFGATKSGLDKTAADLRDKRLIVTEENKLTSVELTAKGQTIQFGRNAQNEWQIVKPAPMRADNFAVGELIRKLTGARMDAAPGESGPAGSGQRVATARLTDSTGTHTLEVFRQGENYAARGSAVEGLHKVSNELGEGVNKGLDDFRNKKIFDFGFTDATRIELRDGDKTYSFARGGEKWWANGKEMDATSIQSLVDKLRDLTAQRFATTGFSAPAAEITITAGQRSETAQFARTPQTVLARRPGEPTVYEIEPKLFDEIRNAAADVRAPAPPPPASAK